MSLAHSTCCAGVYRTRYVTKAPSSSQNQADQDCTSPPQLPVCIGCSPVREWSPWLGHFCKIQTTTGKEEERRSDEIHTHIAKLFQNWLVAKTTDNSLRLWQGGTTKHVSSHFFLRVDPEVWVNHSKELSSSLELLLPTVAEHYSENPCAV